MMGTEPLWVLQNEVFTVKWGLAQALEKLAEVNQNEQLKDQEEDLSETLDRVGKSEFSNFWTLVIHS